MADNNLLVFRTPGGHPTGVERCQWCGVPIDKELTPCPGDDCSCHPRCVCEDCQADRRKAAARAPAPRPLVGWAVVRESQFVPSSCAVCGERVLLGPGDQEEAAHLRAEPVCVECIVSHRIPLASRLNRG